MHTELRPLSLGEILDRTFQLYRSHFLMFVGISMVTAAIDFVWKLIQTGITRVLVHHIAVTALGVVSSGFAFVNLFVYTVASAVAIAATCRAVSAIYLGQSTSMIQAYGEIRAHWVRQTWRSAALICRPSVAWSKRYGAAAAHACGAHATG